VYSDPESGGNVTLRDKSLCTQLCEKCTQDGMTPLYAHRGHNKCNFKKDHSGKHLCCICRYPTHPINHGHVYNPNDYEPLFPEGIWTQEMVDAALDAIQKRYPWITRSEADDIHLYNVSREVSTRCYSTSGGRKNSPFTKLEIKYRRPM
jgi:hypothetical protein